MNLGKLNPYKQEKTVTNFFQIPLTIDNVDCFLKKIESRTDSSLQFYNTEVPVVWNKTETNNTFISFEPVELTDSVFLLDEFVDKEVKGNFIDDFFKNKDFSSSITEIISTIKVTNTIFAEVTSRRQSDADGIMTKIIITEDTGSTGINKHEFIFYNDHCEFYKPTYEQKQLCSLLDRNIYEVKDCFNDKTLSKSDKVNDFVNILEQGLEVSLSSVDYSDGSSVETIDKTINYFEQDIIMIDDIDDLKDAISELNEKCEVEDELDDFIE